MSDFEDDFGDFNDVSDFKDLSIGPETTENSTDDKASEETHSNTQLDPTSSQAQLEETTDTKSVPGKNLVVPSIRSLKEGDLEAIRKALPSPDISTDEKQHSTPVEEDTSTSELLWKHLTERSGSYMPDWNSSQIHKLLAVKLGVPLNLDLDKTLKRRVQRNLELPSEAQAVEGLQGLQDVPLWRILSEVSLEAISGMSDSELGQHLDALRKAVSGAEALKSKLEDDEIDLVGDQNVLEGMVESLLVYSQRTHRERLLRKK